VRYPDSFGARVGLRMLAGLVVGAVAWYPIGRLLFDASAGPLGPVARGLPEIVRFLVMASIAFEAAALLGVAGLVMVARSGGSLVGAAAGMVVPGLVMAGVALALPADQTVGIIALVSPLIACFCSALGSCWREVVPAREPTTS
jgi:hypothetical protein